MDRTRKSSNVPSNFKLEPLDSKTQRSTQNKSKLNTRLERASENSLTYTNKMTKIIQNQDVRDLERKILKFDAKDDTNITSKHLFELRRNYDQMSKEIAKKELEADNLRGEIEVMKRTILLSKQSEEASKRNMEEFQKNVQNIQSKQTSQQKCSKTLQHIINRMRKDEFIHKTRAGILQKKVDEIQALIRDSEQKSLTVGQQQSANLVMISKVKQDYLETNKQRLVNFNLYQNLILKREEGEMAEEQRMKATQQIQAIASSDLNDNNLLKWKKLLIAQMFLRKILKAKIANVEDRYKDITRCYNSIKTKTIINTPSELGQSYFQLQNIYKLSLQKVIQLQAREKELHFQKDELQKQWKKQQTQLWEQNLQKQEECEKSDIKCKKEEVFDKWLKLSLIEVTIKNWMESSRKRLNDSNIDSVSYSGDKQRTEFNGFSESIKQYCNRLLEVSENLSAAEQPLARFQELKVLQSVIVKDPEQGEVPNEEIGEQNIIIR